MKKIKPGNLEVINLVFQMLWLLNSVLNHADIIRSHKCKTEARDDHALTMQCGQYRCFMKIKHDHALSMKQGHNICMIFLYFRKETSGNLEVIFSFSPFMVVK